MGQEAAEVAIAAFADPAEVPVGAGRRFPRREPEPTRKVAPPPKRMDVSHGSDHGGGGDNAHTRHLLEARGHGMLACHAPERAVDRDDPCLDAVG